jgi:hypothetical protein
MQHISASPFPIPVGDDVEGANDAEEEDFAHRTISRSVGRYASAQQHEKGAKGAMVLDLDLDSGLGMGNGTGEETDTSGDSPAPRPARPRGVQGLQGRFEKFWTSSKILKPSGYEPGHQRIHQLGEQIN